MMKMDISPTAPSAAMGWRSYCVGTTAAAGPAPSRRFSLDIFKNGDEYSPVLFLGLTVFFSSSSSICRSYCEDCLNILVGAGTFDSLKLLEPWICFLCQPHRPHGALVPREDWSIRVQGLFANNSAMEFVSDPFVCFTNSPAV